MKRRKILIIGLGLIGGSIAKAIRKDSNNYVIGFDVNEKALEYALENGIINESANSIEELANSVDIILLAAPISITIDYIKKLNNITFSKDVIVSDTCSVKAAVMKEAKNLTNEHITFIGGHPMAGSHKNGIEAAKAHLFENAIYILSPFNGCKEEKVQLLKETLLPTNSRFVVLEPEAHDEMTGVVSHFPHLIASSLVHQARKWQKKHDYLPELAAGGFRDITRIASSNPELWQDIFHHNEKRMSRLLTEWIEEMQNLKDMLNQQNKLGVTSYLKEAKAYRDGLKDKKRGAVPSFYDIFVDIRDQPGALAKLLDILASEAINIVNIRILEIRQGITGAVRLSVTSLDEQTQAMNVLREKGYEVLAEP